MSKEIEIKEIEIKKNKEKKKWFTRENILRFSDLILLTFMVIMLIINATHSYTFAWYQYLPPIINLIILNLINWIFVSYKSKEKNNYWLVVSNIFRKSILIIVLPSYIIAAIISYFISNTKITLIFERFSFNVGNTVLYCLLLIISAVIILIFMIIDFTVNASLINDNQELKEKNLEKKSIKKLNLIMLIWNIIYYLILSVGVIIFISLKVAEKRKKYLLGRTLV